jgi:drug/metabolite transporter (DMT)-like permease
MLSAKEKRFKRYWEEQRKGGKWAYLLLYTFCFTFIVIISPILLSIFFSIFSFFEFDKLSFWGLLFVVAIFCFAGSYYSWDKNEKKWQSLIKQDSRPSSQSNNP